VRELKDIGVESEKLQERIYQMLPLEHIIRTEKKYEEQKKTAKAVLGEIENSLREQVKLLEEVKRDLG